MLLLSAVDFVLATLLQRDTSGRLIIALVQDRHRAREQCGELLRRKNVFLTTAARLLDGKHWHGH